MEFLSRSADMFPLWNEAFGDSRETVQAFLTAIPHTPFYAAEDGQILSMLFAVPQMVGQCKAAYLYAVATAKKARGRGLAASLLRHAEGVLKQDGFSACLLSPAEPSLAGWYMRQGYENWGPFRPLPRQNVTGASVTPEEYRLLREEKLQNIPHNTPPKEILALYTLTDNGAWDGGRLIECLAGSIHGSPAPILCKPFSPDFPKEGYFSFVMD